MSALAALAAFPAAAAVIWATLHTRIAGRVVAAPSDERWHTEATPSLGGVGIFLGILACIGAALAVGGVDGCFELFSIVGGCAILFVAGLADDLRAL
ncbi:MAG: hypothetical protein ACR2MU_08980, partial [Gaiellaceae bacterium]